MLNTRFFFKKHDWDVHPYIQNDYKNVQDVKIYDQIFTNIKHFTILVL